MGTVKEKREAEMIQSANIRYPEFRTKSHVLPIMHFDRVAIKKIKRDLPPFRLGNEKEATFFSVENKDDAAMLGFSTEDDVSRLFAQLADSEGPMFVLLNYKFENYLVNLPSSKKKTTTKKPPPQLGQKKPSAAEGGKDSTGAATSSNKNTDANCPALENETTKKNGAQPTPIQNPGVASQNSSSTESEVDSKTEEANCEVESKTEKAKTEVENKKPEEAKTEVESKTEEAKTDVENKTETAKSEEGSKSASSAESQPKSKLKTAQDLLAEFAQLDTKLSKFPVTNNMFPKVDDFDIGLRREMDVFIISPKYGLLLVEIKSIVDSAERSKPAEKSKNVKATKSPAGQLVVEGSESLEGGSESLGELAEGSVEACTDAGRKETPLEEKKSRGVKETSKEAGSDEQPSNEAKPQIPADDPMLKEFVVVDASMTSEENIRTSQTAESKESQPASKNETASTSDEEWKEDLKRTVLKCLIQLKKNSLIMSYLTSDMPDCPKARKIAAFPKVPRATLETAFRQNADLLQVACKCFEVGTLEAAMRHCLCAEEARSENTQASEQTADPKEQMTGRVDAFQKWWAEVSRTGSQAGSSSSDQQLLSLDNYEQLIARFCGKYSKLEGHTVSDCIHLTGVWFGRSILTEEQLDILECKDPFVYLSGAPGSGKTLLMGVKAAEWAKAGDVVYVVCSEGVNAGSLVSWLLHRRVKESLGWKEAAAKDTKQAPSKAQSKEEPAGASAGKGAPKTENQKKDSSKKEASVEKVSPQDTKQASSKDQSKEAPAGASAGKGDSKTENLKKESSKKGAPVEKESPQTETSTKDLGKKDASVDKETRKTENLKKGQSEKETPQTETSTEDCVKKGATVGKETSKAEDLKLKDYIKAPSADNSKSNVSTEPDKPSVPTPADSKKMPVLDLADTACSSTTTTTKAAEEDVSSKKNKPRRNKKKKGQAAQKEAESVGPQDKDAARVERQEHKQERSTTKSDGSNSEMKLPEGTEQQQKQQQQQQPQLQQQQQKEETITTQESKQKPRKSRNRTGTKTPADTESSSSGENPPPSKRSLADNVHLLTISRETALTDVISNALKESEGRGVRFVFDEVQKEVTEDSQLDRLRGGLHRLKQILETYQELSERLQQSPVVEANAGSQENPPLTTTTAAEREKENTPSKQLTEKPAEPTGKKSKPEAELGAQEKENSTPSKQSTGETESTSQKSEPEEAQVRAQEKETESSTCTPSKQSTEKPAEPSSQKSKPEEAEFRAQEKENSSPSERSTEKSEPTSEKSKPEVTELGAEGKDNSTTSKQSTEKSESTGKKSKPEAELRGQEKDNSTPSKQSTEEPESTSQKSKPEETELGAEGKDNSTTSKRSTEKSESTSEKSKPEAELRAQEKENSTPSKKSTGEPESTSQKSKPETELRAQEKENSSPSKRSTEKSEPTSEKSKPEPELRAQEKENSTPLNQSTEKSESTSQASKPETELGAQEKVNTPLKHPTEKPAEPTSEKSKPEEAEPPIIKRCDELFQTMQTRLKLMAIRLSLLQPKGEVGPQLMRTSAWGDLLKDLQATHATIIEERDKLHMSVLEAMKEGKLESDWVEDRLKHVDEYMKASMGFQFHAYNLLLFFQADTLFTTLRDLAQSHAADVSVWCSSIYPAYQPNGFTVKRLTRCVRCPPVVQEIMKMTADSMKNPPECCYALGRLKNEPPYPVIGPKVKFLDHAHHMTSPRSEVNDCTDCGLALADYLLRELNIDLQPKKTKHSSKTKKGQGGQGELSIEDVIITGSPIHHSNSRFVQALRDRGIGIQFETPALPSPPPYPNKLLIMGGSTLQGLEAKIVVYIPEVARITMISPTLEPLKNQTTNPPSKDASLYDVTRPKAPGDSSAKNASPDDVIKAAPGDDVANNYASLDNAKKAPGDDVADASSDDATKGSDDDDDAIDREVIALVGAEDEEKLRRLGGWNREYIWNIASRSLSHFIVFHI